jgi:serine/threonine-protein kinase
MPAVDSPQIGKLAVERGLISFDHLAEAIREHERRLASGAQVSLGDLLVEMELLTRRQLESLQSAGPGAQTRKQPIQGYELQKRLGEGGMGATYLARQLSMDRLVALKVLRRNLARNSDFLSRFSREARLAGRLDHPNIVQALDVGESGGFHYLVMEYVEGRSVYELMPKQGAMAEGQALRLCLQVARALEYAHRHGVVHRDVKPDNILVTGQGVAKLCDFGLARDTHAETRLTQTGMMMGTPHYASPEQARGQKDVDIRSDIYSLGATLYHMVTGQPPFSGSSAAVVMTKHLTEQMPWPADVNPTVSDNCCRLIARMMAKDPADRYATPAELISDLQLVVGGMRPAGADLAAERSAIALSGTLSVPRTPDPARATVQIRSPVPQAEPGEFPEVDGMQWVEASAEVGGAGAEAPLEAGDSGDAAAAAAHSGEAAPAQPFAFRRRPGAHGARAGEAAGGRSAASSALVLGISVAGLVVVAGIVLLAMYVAESRSSGIPAAPGSAPVVSAGGADADANRKLREAVQGLFKGKLRAFNPASRSVELTYDFESPGQIADWQPGPNCRWVVENGRLACKSAAFADFVVWKGELDPQALEVAYSAKGKRDLNCAVCCRAGDPDPASSGWWAAFGALGEVTKAQIGLGGRAVGKAIAWDETITHRLALVKEGGALELRLGGTELLRREFDRSNEGRSVVLWTRNSPTEYDDVVIRGRLDRAWLEAALKAPEAAAPAEQPPGK